MKKITKMRQNDTDLDAKHFNLLKYRLCVSATKLRSQINTNNSVCIDPGSLNNLRFHELAALNERHMRSSPETE